MKITTGSIVAVALFLAVGTLVVGMGREARASSKNPEPALTCSIRIPKPAPADLSTLAKIKAQDALTAAQKAYPGIAVKKVELDNENGCLVYSVDLINGMDVKVDAGNGSVLYHEKADKEGHEGREGKDEED